MVIQLIGVSPRDGHQTNQSLSSLDSRLFAHLSLFLPLSDKCTKFPRLSRSINQLFQFVQRDISNSFVHDCLHIDSRECALKQSQNQSIKPKCKFAPYVGTLIGEESSIEFRGSVTQHINQAINQCYLHSLGWSYGPLRHAGSLPVLMQILKQSGDLSINQSITPSHTREVHQSILRSFTPSLNQPNLHLPSLYVSQLTRLDLRLTCEVDAFKSIDWSGLQSCSTLSVLYVSLPPVVRDRYSDLKAMTDHLPSSITHLGIHVGDLAWNSAFKNASLLPSLTCVDTVNHRGQDVDMRLCAELATTRMNETEKIRPIHSISTRLIDETDIRYLTAFESLTQLNATLMSDRLLSLTRVNESSLPHLHTVRLHIPCRARLPAAHIDVAALLLLLARRPMRVLTLQSSNAPTAEASECNMQPINDAGLKALASMKQLRQLVLMLPTRGRRLFASDDIGRSVGIGCWPEMHTLHLKADIPLVSPQVEWLLRGAPHLKDLLLSASSTCLAKIVMHGRELVRVEVRDHRRDPKSPVSVHEMQHAFSMASINHSNFSSLFMLKLFDQLSPAAYHFLISRLSYAPRLRYFIDENGLPPLIAEKEVFHLCMKAALPHLDSILPERYSKSIQQLYRRSTYSTSDFIETARYNHTTWTFGRNNEFDAFSEDAMLHEIHQSSNGVYSRFKQLSGHSEFHDCDGRDAFLNALSAQLSKSDADRIALWASGNYSTGTLGQRLLSYIGSCTPFLLPFCERSQVNVRKVLPAARARTNQMTRIM